jgi:hypothetical protein
MPLIDDFKPITEWTQAELIAAAQERGTGMDPIFDEMLRRMELAESEPDFLSEALNSGDGSYKP